MKDKFRNLLHPGHGLYQRTVRSGAWVFALKVTQRALNIIRLIILARILAPDDFGLMGIAMLAMLTLETFSQTGFTAALIQKKEKTEGYLDAAWTVSALRGLIIFVVLFFAAPYVAIFFDTPTAAPIIKVISISALLGGFRNIGVIYFQKELEFRKQFVYELIGTLANFIVTVSVALVLRSVWALVFGSLAGAIVKLITSYFVHPYRPHLSLELGKAKELFGFGKWILGSSILIFLITHGDDIFVGKLLGVTFLGFYQMAYRFSNAPATEISHVISRVTFPAYSKLQDNLPALRKGFLKTLQLTAFISIPLAGGIFILAPEFTMLFLGEKWMPMVPAMQALCVFGALRSINATWGSLFQSVGRPSIITRVSFIQLAVLAVIIYPFTIRWGILGTSIAIVICNFLNLIMASREGLGIINESKGTLARILALPLLISLSFITYTYIFKVIAIDRIPLVATFVFSVLGILVIFLIYARMAGFSPWNIFKTRELFKKKWK